LAPLRFGGRRPPKGTPKTPEKEPKIGPITGPEGRRPGGPRGRAEGVLGRRPTHPKKQAKNRPKTTQKQVKTRKTRARKLQGAAVRVSGPGLGVGPLRGPKTPENRAETHPKMALFGPEGRRRPRVGW